MATDVLIVGAGPTGLMLANQLARRGVRLVIIDRHSGPAQQTRAMAVQARTLEIYAALGLSEGALELGQKANAADLWANGAWRARIPLGDIGRNVSPFPFVLMLGQDDNERIMGEKLRGCDVAVQWNTELTAVEQRSDRVIATVKQRDGSTRAISTAWVAGCDGGHSTVRELAGITFPGAPYEDVFFVADTECQGPMVQDELNVYLWRDGFHLFFPMRGADRWRVIGILPATLRDRDALTFDDVVPAIVQEAGAGITFTACNWFSTYRIHHRCARRFRDRRCFLLGDAAHVHSPMGGQGMNTGLQDAYNLAWKLALVVQGKAAPALLDSYEDERMPVAHRLLQTTDRAFMLIVSDGWIARLFRTRLMAALVAQAMRFERVRALAFRTISQTGIRYRESALSLTLAGVPARTPRAGDRFPWLRVKPQGSDATQDLYQVLADTRFNLVVIGGEAPDASLFGIGDLLHTYSIETDDPGNRQALAAACIPAPSFYLLRPDGHIGLAGIELKIAEVTRYLAMRLQMDREALAARVDNQDLQ